MGQQSQGRGTGDKATGAQAAAVSREWMRRLPAVAAAVVVALMVAFFGITLNNTMATTAQMDAIRAGAYPGFGGGRAGWKRSWCRCAPYPAG